MIRALAERIMKKNSSTAPTSTSRGESLRQPSHGFDDAHDDVNHERGIRSHHLGGSLSHRSRYDAGGKPHGIHQYTMQIIMAFLMLSMMSIMLPRGWYRQTASPTFWQRKTP